MLLVVLLIFTGTRAAEDCEYIINIKRGEIRRVPSPSYPNNDKPFTRCQWTVQAPTDSRGIVFNCPFPNKPPAPNNKETKDLPCHGHFSVKPQDETKMSFCTDRSFSHTTTKKSMVIMYWVPENITVDYFVCYAYEDEKRPDDALVSKFYGCDYTIELKPGVTQQLQTKNFPRPDPPGSACAWLITSTEYNSRIKLSCPTYKPNTVCTGWFHVFRFYDPKSHCNDNRFIEYSTGNTMEIMYYTNMTNRPVDPPLCFISVEAPMSLVTTTVRYPPRNQFAGCDYSVTFNKKIHSYEVNKPNKVPCRWWVKSPINTRIHVACPNLHQVEDKCTGVFTVKRILEPLSFCNNKRFNEYSDTNEMILEFNTFQPNGVFSSFKCFLSAENETDVCQCGRRKTQARIINGEDAGINEFPMMAGLRLYRNVEFFCGATIISDRYALTAAICVENKRPNDIELVVGEHDRSQHDETWSTELYEIDRIVVHPHFERTKINGFVENDIALVHVVTQIRFNSKVGPVCLPFVRKNDLFVDQDVISLGWGKTGSNFASSKILQKVKGFAWSDLECLKLFHDFPLKSNQLCITSNNRSTCEGDSGGPVLWTEPTKKARMFLVAIHSTDQLCNQPGRPSIKTRVTSYLDWIEENTPGARFCKE